jgi:hypothetical protein
MPELVFGLVGDNFCCSQVYSWNEQHSLQRIVHNNLYTTPIMLLVSHIYKTLYLVLQDLNYLFFEFSFLYYL